MFPLSSRVAEMLSSAPPSTSDLSDTVSFGGRDDVDNDGDDDLIIAEHNRAREGKTAPSSKSLPSRQSLSSSATTASTPPRRDDGCSPTTNWRQHDHHHHGDAERAREFTSTTTRRSHTGGDSRSTVSNSTSEETTTLPYYDISCSSGSSSHSNCVRSSVLNFEALEDAMVGREAQKRILQHAIDDMFRSCNSSSSSSNKDGAAQDSTRSNISSNPSPHKIAAIISGKSGSGKSALSMHFQRHCTLDRLGFFVSGKFDLQETHAFSGVKAALQDLCNQILALPNRRHQGRGADGTCSGGEPHDVDHHGGHDSGSSILAMVRKQLAIKMSSREIQAIETMVPAIAQIMDLAPTKNIGEEDEVAAGVASTTSTTGPSPKNKPPSCDASVTSASSASLQPDYHTPDGSSYRAASDRLKFSLKKFVQVVSSVRPLILVVHDLQWADTESIDLLESWMAMEDTSSSSSRGTISRFMLIANYRSEEIVGNERLVNFIRALDDSAQRERSLRFIPLELHEWTTADIRNALQLLLSYAPGASTAAATVKKVTNAKDVENKTLHLDNMDVDVDMISSLAQYLSDESNGNIYYVKQMLENMIHNETLRFATDKRMWMWNAPVLESRTRSSAGDILLGQTILAHNNTASEDSNTGGGDLLALMNERMNKIPAAKQILPVAACLGARFSEHHLRTVLRTLLIHSSHSTFFRKLCPSLPINLTNIHVHEYLTTCEKEGFISKTRQPSSKWPSRRSGGASAKKKSLSFSSSSGTVNDGTKSRRKSKGQPARASSKNIHYNFTHDKIQESALSLVSSQNDPDTLTELQYRVGEALLAGLQDDEDMKDKVFTVAGLLNSRLDLVPDHKNGNRRKQIVALNYRAGLRAVESCAFCSALAYFEIAMQLLPTDHWKAGDLQQSLGIYSSATECAFVTCDFEKVKTYAATVIEQDCGILDKIRAYHVLVDTYAAQGNVQKGQNAATLCVDILQQLGTSFPTTAIGKTLTTLKGMIKLKHAVSRWTLTMLEGMPLCTDPKEEAIMKTLDKLMTSAYLADPGLLPLAILKSVRRTMQNGISEHSPNAFAMQALLLGYFMGDVSGGRKLADISIEMLKYVDSTAAAIRTTNVAYSTSFHWTSPVEDGFEHYLECYRVGMAVGEVETAMWSIFGYLQTSLLVGTSRLDALDEDMTTYSAMMKEFRQNNQYQIIRMNHQVVHNLRGKSKHRSKLIGSIFNEQEELRNLEREPDPQRSLSIQSNKLIAAVYLSEYHVGAKIGLETHEQRLKMNGAMNSLAPTTFWVGLCCCIMGNKESTLTAAAHIPSTSPQQVNISSSLKLKYRKYAQKCRTKLVEWQQKGNPNCTHFISFLNAEHDVLACKYEAAAKGYMDAIRHAKQRGFVHDEALAHERLADCLLAKGNRKGAVASVKECMRLTKEWGATAKVNVLNLKYGGLH